MKLGRSLAFVLTLFAIGQLTACGPKAVRGDEVEGLDDEAMSTGLDRRDLQKIAINFAKRFGGGSVRERFRDYPQVPPELLDAFPKLKRPV